MLHRKLYEKALRDQRWQIIGYGLALAVIAIMDVLIWPAYKDQLQLIELPPALEAFLGANLAISTPAGYLNAEFFSWIIVLMMVYAVMQGTGAIAGEESSGTIDLLLAQPISRTSITLTKAAATVTGTACIILIGYLGFLVTLPFIAMDVALIDVFVACVNMLPVTVFFFALSLWLGAVAPSRAYASACAIAVATAAYAIETIASGVDEFQSMRYASPFYYYGRGLPLVEGIDWWHVGVLGALAAILLALATRTFAARDVTIGGASQLTWHDVRTRIIGARPGAT
jgi:beta-exotoxin I transport system permease protein